MGYFDALTTGSFKTGADGSKLFFPWGVLGKGYVISTDAEYQRLRQQVKAYLIVTLILIIGLNAVFGLRLMVMGGLLLVLFYGGWMLYLLPRLVPSGEKLSLQESMTSQARTHNVVTLWLLQIASIVFVIIGTVLLFGDSQNRLIGLSSVLFFGVCAIFIGRMILLRQRGIPPTP